MQNSAPLPQVVVDGIPLDKLRSLAQDSLLDNPKQASFFASLLYAKTRHAQDALLLAQSHLQAGSYNASLRILEESTLLQSQSPWKALLVACAALAAQDEWPSVVELLEDACRLPEDSQNAPPSLLTPRPPLADDDDFGWHVLQDAVEDPTVLAQILSWRGRAYHETGHTLRSALYWKRALKMDPYCQNAWQSLQDRNLLTPQQAVELVASLDLSPDQEWLRSLYYARIETSGPSEQAFGKLWDEHQWQQAPEVLAMAARRAFMNYQWKETLQYAEQLAQMDPNVTGAAYCYMSALVVLGHKQVLFRLGHEWVEANPKSAQAWFAVGAYYYACQRYHVAQRHFCRATRLDPQCTEAWIAFGCAFCACDESDQALASFRAAQRLSPGDHTSLLYMGMEYVRTNHLVLAHYFLEAASPGKDPLCFHEQGVMHFLKGECHKAIHFFNNAIARIAPQGVEWVQDPYWEPTLFNLGHAYRKTRQFGQAEACYKQCVALEPQKTSAWSALALVQHLQNKLEEAIASYHKALSFKADDAFATEMLMRALKESAVLVEADDGEDNNLQMNASSISSIPDTPGSVMMSSMDMSGSSPGL